MTILIRKDVLREELLASSTIVWSLLFAIVYLFLSTLLFNTKLLSDTLTGAYPVSFKVHILTALLMGITNLYSPGELSILFLLGLLMGFNLVLVIKSLRQQKMRKGVSSLGFGAVGLIAATGCASCGVTLFSLIGPSVSLSLLPFQGPVLQGVSFIMLAASLFYTLNRKTAVCKIR